MTSNRKPNVFIGSSREALPYAEAVAARLEYETQVNPWYAGTFGPNAYTMDDLDRELDANDFGVFVFAAEDIAKIRDEFVFITRDNTLFEMGLFWGRLGRKRVFCIIPRVISEGSIGEESITTLHLPSDLEGLNLLRYSSRDDGKHAAAISTACGEILKAVQREGLFKQLAFYQAQLDRRDSVLLFFWEFIRNVQITDSTERYSAYAEAIRNSILPPTGFRTTGAALWKKIDDEHMGQVGGNVGRGRIFHLKANEGKPQEEHIYVLQVFGKPRDWNFFGRREIAPVHVICYAIDKQHVLSVHFSGNHELNEEQSNEIVETNKDLLLTISGLIGGVS